MRLAAALFFPGLLAIAAPADPQLSADAITNAADHSTGRVSPGEILVLHPLNAGPEILVGSQLNPDGTIATLLSGTRVLFDGVPAPISYTVAGEISAVVPYEISGRQTTNVVVEYDGRRSAPVTVPVVAAAPALFTLDSSGTGQAAMLNETGCCNSIRNPAARGAVVVLYATGAGVTDPPSLTGHFLAYDRTSDYPAPRLPVRVTIGGEPAELIFVGAAPHAVTGFLQINFRVPAKAPVGDAVPVVLTIGNARSRDGVTMAIRSAQRRILIADPNRTTRDWLQKTLQSAGFEVSTEPAASDFDLAMFSLSIPEAERAAALRALQSDHPRLKTAVIAKALDPAAIQAADLLGAQAVFTPPFNSQALIRRVQELLRPRPVPYVP